MNRFLTCIVLVIFLVQPAEAFRSTKQQSYTDPDYVGFKPKTILLVVESGNFEIREKIEERISAELEKYGITTLIYNDIFPPTRDWSPDDRSKAYERHSIDSGLIIKEGASSSVVIPMATQTYSTATAYASSNGTYGSGQSTSYNLFGAKSKANFSAVLFIPSANRVAWYCDILVKAAGTLFVSDKGDAKGAVNGIIDGLKESGHIEKKKK